MIVLPWRMVALNKTAQNSYMASLIHNIQLIFLTLRFDCVYMNGLVCTSALVSSGKCSATMGRIFDHTVDFFRDS